MAKTHKVDASERSFLKKGRALPGNRALKKKKKCQPHKKTTGRQRPVSTENLNIIRKDAFSENTVADEAGRHTANTATRRAR